MSPSLLLPPPPPALSGVASPRFPPRAAPPKTAPLLLSKSAKRIVAAFLVVGGLAYLANAAISAIVFQNNQSAVAALQNDYGALSKSITSAESQLSACGRSLRCAEAYQAKTAAAFDGFGSTLTTISFPAWVQRDASQLEAVTTSLVGALRRLSDASAGAYSSELSRAEALGNQFDTDYDQLAAALL